MSTVAEVRLWGRTIGAIALEEDADTATFQYERDFARSGIQVSPLVMPLSDQVYSFPALSSNTYHGLPGLLADSLPDRFGNALIDAWLSTQGRLPGSFNAIERLCYTGDRGMGALGFIPATGPDTRATERIHVDQLVGLASEILAHRHGLSGSFDDDGREAALKNILRVGTSAGGARAKAAIAWNPVTDEVRSGQVEADDGFQHWLIKFDGVAGSGDHGLTDPLGYGLIEFAYHRMAMAAGVTMNECRIFKENGRHHFMTRRFDRTEGGGKLHMQTLGALAHYDFNLAGAHSYEQALLAIRQLELPMAAIEEQFRRMVFNIISRNQDDHVKNIAFLMDRTGQWSTSPAYDVTYSYQPAGEWTSRHQMTMNGKRDDFTMADFRQCARSASMKRGRADQIVSDVLDTVRHWHEYADAAGVDSEHRDRVQQTLRLDLPP